MFESINGVEKMKAIVVSANSIHELENKINEVINDVEADVQISISCNKIDIGIAVVKEYVACIVKKSSMIEEWEKA